MAHRAAMLAVVLAACSPERARSPDRSAASVPQSDAGGARATQVSDDGPCMADAECGFTRHEPGDCCPTLCTPRAVLRSRAPAASCRGCALPSCAPPQWDLLPVCRQGRCVAERQTKRNNDDLVR